MVSVPIGISTYSAQLRDRSLYYESIRDDIDRPIMVIEHVSRLFEWVGIESVMRSVDDCPFGIDGVSIRWSYHDNPSIGQRIVNAKHTIHTFRYDAWVATHNDNVFLPDHNVGCLCNTHFRQYCSVETKYHVCTGSIDNIIPDDALAQRLSWGANFRDTNDASLTGAVDALRKGFHLLALQNRDMQPNIRHWGDAVIARFIDEFNARTAALVSPHVILRYIFPTRNTIDEDLLRELSRDFVFVRIDKATSNIGFMCKHWFFGHVVKFLSDDSHYSRYNHRTDLLIDALQAQTHDLLSPTHRIAYTKELPYFYVAPKMHKSPIAARPIAAAHDCVLSNIQRVLAITLRLILDTLRDFHAQEFALTGIRKYWLVENSLEFILTRPDTINDIFTSDVDSMFHNLHQQFIFEAVSSEVQFTYLHVTRASCIMVRLNQYSDGDKAFWHHTHHADEAYMKGTGCYTRHDIISMVLHVLRNIYVQAGDATFRQTCGIPMGGASSSHLANLALHHQEKAYVVANPDTPFQHMIWRYADDFCVINCPEFAEIYRDVYPAHTGVTLVHVTMPDQDGIITQAYFLDMHIYVEHTGEVYITVYDKRTAFQFDIHKFPHGASNACVKQIHNIFFGELVRLYRINTHFTLFLQNVADLYTYCIRHKGYQHGILMALTRKFARAIHGRNHFRATADLIIEAFEYVYQWVR